MKYILFAGCLLALLAPAAFAAEGGLYFSLYGGGALVDDVENDSATGSFNLSYDPGWTGGAAIGYDLRTAFPEIGTGRVELEVSWRQNDLDQVEFAEGKVTGSGTATTESIMLNTIGEYRDTLPWIPYVGIGAGAARITLDALRVADFPLVDGEDTVFAWQVLAGVGVQVAPRLYLDLGYRYFATLDPGFTDALGQKFDSQYDTHNATFGMRIDF